MLKCLPLSFVLQWYRSSGGCKFQLNLRRMALGQFLLGIFVVVLVTVKPDASD